MKNNKVKFAICVAIPLIVGGLSALITMNSMKDFELLNQPPLSPPRILFPIAWTILYIMMGVASYLVCTSNAKTSEKNSAFIFYGIQLFLNFFWAIIFFNAKAYLFAFIWLLVLLGFIICTAVKFCKIDKWAGCLMVPYIIWCVFAAYLNFGVYLLN